MLLVPVVTADPSEPCVLMVRSYASVVSKPDREVVDPVLSKHQDVVCVCVLVQKTSLVVDNDRVYDQVSILCFSQGGRRLCGRVIVVLRCLVFTASFTGSLFRHSGCECIPTFRQITLRLGARPPRKHTTSPSFHDARGIFVFTR